MSVEPEILSPHTGVALIDKGGELSLPESYRHACVALANCERVDECKAWADKSAAIAAYAKMAQDRELEVAAARIRLRATRRIGELLGPLPAWGLLPVDQRAAAQAAVKERAREASGAGIGEVARANARRVARVPETLFENIVEGPNPPGVGRMATLGARDPAAAIEKYKRKENKRTDTRKETRKEWAPSIRREHRLLDLLIDRQPLRSVMVREARQWAEKYLIRARAILLLTDRLDDQWLFGEHVDEEDADRALNSAARGEGC